MREIQEGKKNFLEKTVTKEQLACAVGSGSVPVLATPVLAAFMEEACAALVAPDLPEGITTVGTRLEIEHLCASVEGVSVKVQAELTETEDRIYRFFLKVWDNAGLIAEGTHERVSVKSERFVQKARERVLKKEGL